MAAIIGSVAAMNDFLASDEEDDDLDDIFAISGACVMYVRSANVLITFLTTPVLLYTQSIL